MKDPRAERGSNRLSMTSRLDSTMREWHGARGEEKEPNLERGGQEGKTKSGSQTRAQGENGRVI